MKLTTRDKALGLAASIIDARAAEVERGYVRWRQKYPDDKLGAATEHSAYLECQLLARLVREKMSPAGRAALSKNNGPDITAEPERSEKVQRQLEQGEKP